MAGIYQADVLCDDCVRSIKLRICDELWYAVSPLKCPDGTDVSDFETRAELYEYLLGMDERHYDSDEYPKYCSDYEESDTPQHCGDCGVFLENDLTSDGDDYVREAVREGGPVAELWREWYDYIDFDEDEDEDLCDGCDGSEGCSGECYPHPFTD